jgi:hypothetical protein
MSYTPQPGFSDAHCERQERDAVLVRGCNAQPLRRFVMGVVIQGLLLLQDENALSLYDLIQERDPPLHLRALATR